MNAVEAYLRENLVDGKAHAEFDRNLDDAAASVEAAWEATVRHYVAPRPVAATPAAPRGRRPPAWWKGEVEAAREARAVLSFLSKVSNVGIHVN